MTLGGQSVVIGGWCATLTLPAVWGAGQRAAGCMIGIEGARRGAQLVMGIGEDLSVGSGHLGDHILHSGLRTWGSGRRQLLRELREAH